ncbi:MULTISPECIES: SsrA-binding protein SmpB [Amylolactobacillus]|uniref:SsrA-binding protein n=1 Tax=Amylolactobacillus amylophilus DSM 20533 = JCM 1125 TaxID=1423721 RepID=A0A1L6XDC8_9LACO|nr:MULTISPECIES: SsrA-binding protein SmpB [Amylolactobacillus]APT18975.1 SsrA-binding protein [Amylolactobacillus amylophilus DSM 20533 = JCM 1125]GED79984.1 SsrA-binding protein [Amylolactobacillus amylophilus]
MKQKAKAADNVVAQNRKANHDYLIEDTIEAGIELTGTEIKSVRARRITLKDGYVRIRNGQAWLENVHISEYAQGNQFNHDPIRNRRLLLHKREIARLDEYQQEKGMAIVPLKVYLKRGFAKVLIGLGRGKKNYDKRETIKRRDQERELQRITKIKY